MTNETTASQPKSIGDDAQFQAMTAFMLRNEYYALVKLIDNFRAPAAQASATIQVAPDLTNLLRVDFYPDTGEYESSADGKYVKFADVEALLAATIQEPVMVAEPGLRNSAGARKHAERIDNMHKGVVSVFAAIKAEHEAAPMVADPAGATPEMIQWRNIQKTIDAVADFCFGSKDHPVYGSSHRAVTTCLTARDGVQVTLEPLAAPMVADPAGVAAIAYRVEWENIGEGTAFSFYYGPEAKNDTEQSVKYAKAACNRGATVIPLYDRPLDATVKAVPSEALDGARLRWLIEDHDDAEVREKARELAGRLGTSSYFAITRDIDAAMKIAAPLADKTGGGE